MKKLILMLIALCFFTSAFADPSEDFFRSALKGVETPATKFVSFSYKDIRTLGGIEVSTGPGVFFNRPYPWCWYMCYSNKSYITFNVYFSKEELENPIWYLNIKQLSSISGPTNFSPIAIDVNGVNIVDHHLPQRDAWRIDHFEISQDLLIEGNNQITIRFQNASTNYWVEHMTLSPNEPAHIWII